MSQNISPEIRKDSQPPAVHVSAVLDVQSPNLFVRTDVRRHAVRQTGGREEVSVRAHQQYYHPQSDMPT
jgi:hypothetical protein